MKNIEFSRELAKSYNSKNGCNGNINDILSIIKESHEKSFLSTSIIPLSELHEWNFEKETGNFSHSSKRFFSIIGCKYNNKTFPIIFQPEIGILGFLSAMIEGCLHFLVQLKNEPGNLNGVQISPTVQATKSNYTQVHGGKIPKHLEFFLPGHRNRIIADQYLSEQGFRYFRKRNRNMILYTDHPPNQDATHIWMTIGQIKDLINENNVVNSCARSIISMLTIDGNSYNNSSNYNDNYAVSKMLDFKDKVESNAKIVSLKEVPDWKIVDGKFQSINEFNFKLIGCSISGKNREVSRWNQPLIEELEKGEYGLCIGSYNDNKYILWKVRNEPGLFDNIELGPTWIKRSELFEENILNNFSSTFNTIKKVELAEEGGRFYKSTFIHKIVDLGEFDKNNIPNEIIPLTINETQKLMNITNFFTLEGRSLWSLMKREDFE